MEAALGQMGGSSLAATVSAAAAGPAADATPAAGDGDGGAADPPPIPAGSPIAAEAEQLRRILGEIDAEVESKSEMQRRSVARMVGLSGNAEADCKREQEELGRRITVRGKMVDELAQEMSDMRVGLEKVLGSRMTGARPRAAPPRSDPGARLRPRAPCQHSARRAPH